LPTLGPVLERLRAEVLDGRGFALLRGMLVENRPIVESAAAYWGVGTYFGSARSQNAQGHLLGHVYDLGKGLSATNPNLRSYATAERQNFHIDRCDVVALLCLRRAKSGGLSSIVSSMTVHNVMAERRPDLLDRLYQPSTGVARYRRARHRSTKRRCSTSMPATFRCCIPGCISVRRSGFPRRGGSAPKTSKLSICWPSWRATQNCGST
jgi:Taurine catabolism dioxygenase TauD, TfdA family